MRYNAFFIVTIFVFKETSGVEVNQDICANASDMFLSYTGDVFSGNQTGGPHTAKHRLARKNTRDHLVDVSCVIRENSPSLRFKDFQCWG